MKVIALSDTHMPRMAKHLPLPLVKELEDADLILHAGDWNTKAVFDELSSYAPVYGVTGNTDTDEITALFPARRIVEAGNKKIGVVHGYGKGQTTEKRALQAFEHEDVDLILFGHSHIPVLRDDQRPIILNPGSATDKRRQQHYSFAVITIQEAISVELVFYKEK